MSVSQQIIFFTEIIGTIAFAFSGATVAIRRRMDIFGVLVLGGCTAVGGGLIRDLILGNIPPSMFRKPVYVAVSAITSLAVLYSYAGIIICWRRRAASASFVLLS